MALQTTVGLVVTVLESSSYCRAFSIIFIASDDAITQKPCIQGTLEGIPDCCGIPGSRNVFQAPGTSAALTPVSSNYRFNQHSTRVVN